MTDYLGIIVATVAAFAVGALWYGPLFGRQWRLLMHFSDEHLGAPEGSVTGAGLSMPRAMAGGFISTLVLVAALAYLMDALSVLTLASALTVALLVSLGFIATTMANSLWYERRPPALYLINAGHYVVAIIAASLVLFYL